MCRGGAVPRGEVCKTGEAPARGAARSAAGGRRRRPKAGDAFRGGVARPVPLTQNLRGEYGTSPERPPAERVLPAPRAGERTLSAFLHWLRPLRPAPGTVRSPAPRGGDFLYYHDTTIARHTCGNFRSRPARVPRNHFPRCKPRALPEIKDNRLPLHKHSVSTYPLPLTLAFSQKFTVPRNERHSPPLPQKAGADGVGHSLGEGPPSPKGEPFPATFPFVGKSRPRGAKTNNF